MAKWKTKAYKKLSMRERKRLEKINNKAELFGDIPPDRKFAVASAVDKFIRESSCRHMQSMGSPCPDFDADAKGICKRDGRICDVETEKGERYRREYE